MDNGRVEVADARRVRILYRKTCQPFDLLYDQVFCLDEKLNKEGGTKR